MPTFVDFFDPQCPHCQSLELAWATAAKVLHSKSSFAFTLTFLTYVYLDIVPLAVVNCIEESLLCDDHKIERLPTIRMFAERGNAHFEFPHERTAESIVKFAVGALGPNMKAQILSAPDHVRRFVNWQPSKVHYMLVTSKRITPFYQVHSFLSNLEASCFLTFFTPL